MTFAPSTEVPAEAFPADLKPNAALCLGKTFGSLSQSSSVPPWKFADIVKRKRRGTMTAAKAETGTLWVVMVAVFAVAAQRATACKELLTNPAVGQMGCGWHSAKEWASQNVWVVS